MLVYNVWGTSPADGEKYDLGLFETRLKAEEEKKRRQKQGFTHIDIRERLLL